MSKMNILPIVLMMGLPSFALAQKKGDAKTAVALKDSVPKVEPEKNPNAPKRYDEVITKKAVTKSGMFRIHQIDEQYFFEIPDSLLNRDILVVNRISKAPAGLRPQLNVYAGDQVAENVIRFEKGPNHRIFMKRMIFREQSADSTENGMYRSVLNSSLQPIVAAFPVKALGTNNDSYVLDMTSFIQSENEILHFGPEAKKGLALGPVQNDKSYVISINTWPINVEVKAVRTYMPAAAGSTLPTTYELNSSLVLLPKVPMQPRYADARVGFFARGVVDFDAEPQRVATRYFATRWRLEPKPEDRERYLRGELVEPQKPIIYYVDPATPKKWVPYLIAGVNDWQKAFEQAGFKNAIKALPAPENDSTWSIDDARHNVIVYKPSAIANASGPHVHDPRSGEIIETHINWYHNIMALVHDWYMIQAGAIDPRARKMQFDDELMGQLIRFVSSHEVGHTLGLMHNYGSSSTVPVEKLRDKKYVEEHGHTPSIMDYARFNYVAQPEDNISEKGIFPRIGDYDKWAIEWGYKWTNGKLEEETAMLSKLTTEKQSNKRLWFGTETNRDDPRSQNEDLGDNAMIAGNYGIKNLQRILPELPQWTTTPNEGYANLSAMYNQVAGQFGRYIGHVVKNVGGIMETPKMVEQAGPVYERVPKERQQAAMEWLKKQLFTTPNWLLNKEITGKAGIDGVKLVGRLQDQAMNKLFDGRLIDKLITAEAEGGTAYTATEFINDLKNIVWAEVSTRKPIDVYRRNLQKDYIIRVERIFNPVQTRSGSSAVSALASAFGLPAPINETGDAYSIYRASMRALRAEIKAALPAITDRLTRYHLEDMAERLGKMLDPK